MRVYLLLTVCALTVGTALVASGVQMQDNPAPGQQQKLDRAEFEGHFPLADKNKPEPVDPAERAKRRAAGKKHDKSIQPLDERVDTITFSGHWARGLPALPVSRSQAIIVGEIVDAQAYVSNDGTGVYSEFTVRIDDILKSAEDSSLAVGSSVVAERDGGRVRFPSGRVVLVFKEGQGMPRPGRRYVLFLTRGGDDVNFGILTGYELKGGRIKPLDRLNGTHPIAKYEGRREDAFFAELRLSVNGAPGN